MPESPHWIWDVVLAHASNGGVCTGRSESKANPNSEGLRAGLRAGFAALQGKVLSVLPADITSLFITPRLGNPGLPVLEPSRGIWAFPGMIQEVMCVTQGLNAEIGERRSTVPGWCAECTQPVKAPAHLCQGLT